MTQTNPEDNRNPNIKKIEILGGVWFHLVLLQALVGEYITHQMSV
jgi:photosystem II PsbZ protein